MQVNATNNYHGTFDVATQLPVSLGTDASPFNGHPGLYRAMTGVILFGVGSAIVIDFEESLHRARVPLAAGIRNRPGPSYLSEDARTLPPDELGSELLRLPFLVPLFTPGYRQEAAQEAARYGLQHPFSLVDPSVAAPRRLNLGPGTYINAGVSLGGGSTFGAFALINRGASIGHHARLGDFVSIGPGVTLAGDVTIGMGAVIGAGATILPSLTVGENAVVGAGAVITQDVPVRCLAVGNPARIARWDIGGYNGLTVS
jgi:sugar O-acyltransferase (sialic acid O-acetyltransferase NeuD family)